MAAILPRSHRSSNSELRGSCSGKIRSRTRSRSRDHSSRHRRRQRSPSFASGATSRHASRSPGASAAVSKHRSRGGNKEGSASKSRIRSRRTRSPASKKQKRSKASKKKKKKKKEKEKEKEKEEEKKEKAKEAEAVPQLERTILELPPAVEIRPSESESVEQQLHQLHQPFTLQPATPHPEESQRSGHGLCQVLRVSDATRRRIVEGGDAATAAEPSVASSSVGIGSFGRQPKSADRHAASPSAQCPSAEDDERARVPAVPGRGEEADRERERRQQRRRRRSPDSGERRRGREKKSRRRSREGSAGSSRRSSSGGSNASGVGRHRGSGRLKIDRDRLRRRAIENTVMALSERCPEKLATMPCFRALGVRISELESICRRLVAASSDLAKRRHDQASPSTTDKDRHQAGNSTGASHTTVGSSVSSTSVRHPFQLRPESSGASAGSGFAPAANRFASAASHKQELLAAFPVSSGAYHHDEGTAPQPLPPSSSLPAEAAPSLAKAAIGNGCQRGAWEAVKLAPPPPPPPPSQQRSKSPQAWGNKHQFLNAQPITDGIGHRLLQKMGWRRGQGLGKRCEGPTEPLTVGYKTDRKGLASAEDRPAAASRQPFPGKGGQAAAAPASAAATAALGGKHPVCALLEVAKRRRWPDPQFRLVHESGPPHARCFVFCVRVGPTEYQPTQPSPNKKDAKATAASVALEKLGVLAARTG